MGQIIFNWSLQYGIDFFKKRFITFPFKPFKYESIFEGFELIN